MKEFNEDTILLDDTLHSFQSEEEEIDGDEDKPLSWVKHKNPLTSFNS